MRYDLSLLVPLLDSPFRHLPSDNRTFPILPLPWRGESEFTYSSYSPPPPSFVYPSIFTVLFSGCVFLYLWFFNSILRTHGIRWSSWCCSTYKTLFPSMDSPPPKPPDPPSGLLSTPHLLRLFWTINGLLTSPPALASVSEVQFRHKLRKYRSFQGILQTNKLSKHDLQVVQRHLRSSDAFLREATNYSPHIFNAIVDTGCSYSATNTFSDCDPASIRRLTEPITLGGIAGSLQVEFIGTARWDTIDDKGNILPFPEEVLIHEDLPNRLLSPQAFLSHRHRKKTSPTSSNDCFSIFHDRSEWHLQDNSTLTMKYDSCFLPRITLFSQGQTSSALQAMSMLVTSPNHNLSPLQKIWMKWHIKLGHISFSHVQKLAVGGFLDYLGLGLERNKLTESPKCAACQYGKQGRTHDGTTTTTKVKDKIGSLKEGQLQPGDRIFCDQLESRQRGRLLHTAGKELEKNQFCGSTVFCDAASGYLHVEHQVTLNSSDTINAKDNFERVALQYGIDVRSYHTDNGIFKSREFVQEIASNVQQIRYSGVGAKWQNGVAEGAIRILVSKARTAMIHSALHWPEAEDATLWPLALSHAAHLYNHTPNELSGIAPVEIFSRTASDGQALRNSHPWGCPVYVLEPRLTESGGKIPKWQPRSRRAQYMGVSPVHAETVGLVRNLHTGYISPQFHLVYDDWFETVLSDQDPPPQWDHLCTFQRFETYFDDVAPPSLADEWLTPAEQERNKAQRRIQGLRQGRKLWQEVTNKDSRDDAHFEAPTPYDQSAQSTRETPFSRPTTRELPSSWTRDPTSPIDSPPPDPVPPAPPEPSPPSDTAPTSSRRYPQRTRNPPPETKMVMDPNKKTYYRPSSLMAVALALSHFGLSALAAHMLQAQVIGFDPITGFQESLPPGLTQSPLALKAKTSRDPDVPTLKESLNGPYAEHFWEAMDAEIASLESKGTWEVVERSSIPKGVKPVPGTWAQRIKRLPDGSLNKFKSRWCCRGDLQHYDGISYTPLVGWPTVRSALLLAAAHGWTSRQVDFTLAFCQSPQPEDKPLFMELPQYYRPKGFEDKDVLLQLKKSIYGQVDSPRLFYEHLLKGMEQLGFKPSDSDPCLFIHTEHQLMVLNYCDDQIWLSPDNALIEKYVKKLQRIGYDLILEDQGDIFGFLGINFKQDNDVITLSQTGLIKKVIHYTGMQGASSKSSPAAPEPLGSDPDGDPFDEEWSYPAAVGMLLYISSNTRPDIQFSVHQVARFSHAPKKSHGQAIKRIVRYLIETSDKGIIFKPDITQGLDCYVDADFSGLYGYEDEQDPVSVKSRTGFVLTLFGCPVIWSSKLQTDITLSSTAAEYVAFSMAMRELIPMRTLLQEYSDKLGLTSLSNSLVRSTVFEDNQGCLSLVNVPKMSPRNKYLALKYHFFRSNIGEDKGIVAKYVSTLEQKADIFTKGLPPKQFAIIRKLLMGW